MFGGSSRHQLRRFVAALLVSSAVSVGFFAAGAVRNHSFEFGYLVWNLWLAWLPLLFALWLIHILRHKAWSSWEGLVASALWLLFLPNSFYMISDFVHLLDVPRVDVLFDVIMFTSFITVGVCVGFTSVYLVHQQLSRRLQSRTVNSLLILLVLICSFAVYIGRDLRWNSWDVLANPGGLLFDISDRLQHPSAYPQMITTTIAFSVLLGSLYWLFIQATVAVRYSAEHSRLR